MPTSPYEFTGREKIRLCLSCNSAFLSLWPGNRICKVCKTQHKQLYDTSEFNTPTKGDE